MTDRPTTDATLDGLRVLCLTANEGVEQIELTEPRAALQAADALVTLVAPEEDDIQAFDHLDKADTFPAERAVADVSVDDFDALLLPGGVANPDALRMDDDAVALVRAFVEAGKPVAAICHAPWMLVEADCVRGRTLTSWPSLQTDVRNAAGTWVDEEVVVCGGGPGPIVTSRKPADLPAFCDAMLSALQRAPARTGT